MLLDGEDGDVFCEAEDCILCKENDDHYEKKSWIIIQITIQEIN